MKNLNHYRDLLRAREAELSGRLVTREGIEVHIAADMFDEMQLAADRDFAVSNLVRTVRSLREVREALRRMDEGTYGVCLGCEESIPPRRLEAVPWTAYCVVCQEVFDQATAGEREGSADFATEPDRAGHQAAA